MEWTWMRFTVNGQPCRSGSYCTQNANMDIWSCPVDQGDWDYCCRPDHKCGYSEGVSNSWLVEGTPITIKTFTKPDNIFPISHIFLQTIIFFFLHFDLKYLKV